MNLAGMVAAVGPADWIDRVPTVLGAGILVSIIGIVTRLWLGSEKRHKAELDRLEKSHEVELAAVNGRVDRLRTELDQLRVELEEERKQRWRAQDIAAQRRRQQGFGREGNESGGKSG